MAFEETMRRIITGEDAAGKSLVVLDGPPSNAGSANPGSLHEIWSDLLAGVIDTQDRTDRGDRSAQLCPRPGQVKVRWFVVNPLPDAPADVVNPLVRDAFAAIGAADCVTDQARWPTMHRTHSLDVICCLQGEVALVLDNEEVRLKPGNVAIQRGISHAWKAIGGPALMLAVLIERELG